MKTIYINDKARAALERHARSGQFSLGTCKAVTRDVWEVAVEDDVYSLLQKMSQQMRAHELSSTFSDVVLTIVHNYELKTKDRGSEPPC